VKTAKRVAVVVSGPAGLAAAQQLTRAGHDVVVFERADRIGGLLRYGIPEFKMEKRHLERRLDQMRAEGTEFRVNANVGVDVSVVDLRADFDAIVLAGGATAWRDLPIPGLEFGGIYQAMEYLPFGNRVQEGDIDEPPVTAAGKSVVIIGGGDTGADCLGTAHRRVRADPSVQILLARSQAHQPVAHVVEHLPGLVRSRRRWRARLQREHRVLHRRRRGQCVCAPRARGRDGGREVREDRGH
jgi:glutamate synthase (NADPH/NADH) small chain